MKRIAMITVAMFAVAVSYGQDLGGRPHRHSGQDMKEQLSLDSVQYATIKGINRKYHDKVRTLRSDTIQTSEDKRTDWKRLKEERVAEINTVLTPDQRSKWAAVKKERAENRKAAKLEKKAGRDKALKNHLSLTDDQLEKMKSARKDSFENARKDYEKKLKSILSKQQFEEWKKMNREK